jgi:beta-carotene hydroxylase
LRSGTAYQFVHLKHHQHFPSHEDIEGKAAHLSFFKALLYGVLFQPKVWLYIIQQNSPKRRLFLIELSLIIAVWIIAVFTVNSYPQLLIYCIVIHFGSWVIPLMTSYFPHRADGKNEYEQTKRFRGKVFSILSLEHLYHLEHHMYPVIPHQNWPKLARRLDPYLDEQKVKSIKLLD